MQITNFKNLAKNSLRQKALEIAEAGYEAIEIEKVVSRKIKFQNGKLFIKSAMTRHSVEACSEFDLNVYKRVSLIGVGKGSALASATLAKILGDKLIGGIALDVKYQEVGLPKKYSGIPTSQKLEFLVGTHPLPSEQNIKATQKIIKLVKNLKKDDLLITFICGGGSALLCGSEKERKNSILATKLLTQAGANILELNTVRKHLSLVKAGGLAKSAYPANIISLIVSDVLGNDLSIVASGPTVFDKTTKKDAERIWRKYLNMGTSDVPNINGDNFRTSDVQKNLRLSASISALIRALRETPKNKKYFKKVKNILFLSNREPILAMAGKAKELGFKPKIYSYALKGEARNALSSLIKTVPRVERLAVLAGGETVVKLKVKSSKLKVQKLGKGGRNMEAVLGTLTKLIQNSKFKIQNYALLSVASDGRDNTEAAGAIGDILTLQKAQKLKLNPQEFLENHNSFNFFKKTGDLIFAEQKCFNVADLMIVLKE
ncbi:MAG: D-glycerate 2-kinase [Syntrophomonadaceae bacterium]|nr:D-glycerate 2-kinase [Bacillota bacterium]